MCIHIYTNSSANRTRTKKFNNKKEVLNFSNLGNWSWVFASYCRQSSVPYFLDCAPIRGSQMWVILNPNSFVIFATLPAEVDWKSSQLKWLLASLFASAWGIELEVPSIGILSGCLRSLLFLVESGTEISLGSSGFWGWVLNGTSDLWGMNAGVLKSLHP